MEGVAGVGTQHPPQRVTPRRRSSTTPSSQPRPPWSRSSGSLRRRRTGDQRKSEKSCELHLTARWEPREVVTDGGSSLGGAPGRTRTCGRRIRSPLLCPAELRGRDGHRPSAGIRTAGSPAAPYMLSGLVMVAVAQLVRAPRCGRGGREFESRRSPQTTRSAGSVRWGRVATILSPPGSPRRSSMRL